MKCKKLLCLALSAVLLLMLLCGCSTPKIAMTVNGREYPTGEYLAYLFNTYSTMYNNYLYQYEYYGMDIWSQTAPYGEGDDAKQLGMADYIIASTKDTIVRQKAAEELLAKYNLEVSKEDKEEFEKYMANITESTLIPYGFNRENYEKMYFAYNYYSRTLFYGLYGKGGEREMSEADIKKYIEENYLSYRLFSIALTDKNNKDFSDTLKTKIQDFLKGYQTMYEASGDFEKTYDQYVADLKKGVKLIDDKGTLLAKLSWGSTSAVVTLPTDNSNTTTSTTKGTGSTTKPSSTTSTTVSTTTTTASSTTTTTTTAANKDEDEKEEEKPKCDRITTAKKELSDEDMVKAIEKVAVGKTEVVTYAAGGKAATAALIVRYDPLSKDGTTIDDAREDVIYYVHYETFDKEITEHVSKMEITYNDRAISMCRPEYFDPNYVKGQTTTTTTTTKAIATTSSSNKTTTTTTGGSTTTSTTAASK